MKHTLVLTATLLLSPLCALTAPLNCDIVDANDMRPIGTFSFETGYAQENGQYFTQVLIKQTIAGTTEEKSFRLLETKRLATSKELEVLLLQGDGRSPVPTAYRVKLDSSTSYVGCGSYGYRVEGTGEFYPVVETYMEQLSKTKLAGCKGRINLFY